jgi:hypothetical protein
MFDVKQYNARKAHVFTTKDGRVSVFSHDGRTYRESRHRELLHDHGLRLPVIDAYYPDSGWAMLIAPEDGWETLPSGECVRSNKTNPANWAEVPHLIGLPL